MIAASQAVRRLQMGLREGRDPRECVVFAPMANIRQPEDQAGAAPIGSKQGEAPDAPRDTDLSEAGRQHHSRSERAKMIRDPNRNQAFNDRGSADNTQGSQTGNDIDPIPRIPED